MDATANDVPGNFAVRGFPTIFFVPMNKKDSPVKYEGGREVADFMRYLKKNATKGIKGAGSDDKKDKKKKKGKKGKKDEL